LTVEVNSRFGSQSFLLVSNYNQMSASNDELLLNAARDGDLEKVKDLLSMGTVTEFKDVVS
jgi:hypothetical protein